MLSNEKGRFELRLSRSTGNKPRLGSSSGDPLIFNRCKRDQNVCQSVFKSAARLIFHGQERSVVTAQYLTSRNG
jgi:hypothetical protein